MIFLLAALLCLTSGLEEDALARSNKLLRKQNEALVKALHTITEEKQVGEREVTEDEVYTYSVAPGGKCRTLKGEDPKYLYEGGKGSICEQLCDGMNDCFGYSNSGYPDDNCLLWLQRDIMGGGDKWGSADCHIKDISCSGKVGEDYNCFECFNSFSQKYLWGSACQAKNWGADTYTKGVCGKEYKCFTNSEDIGDCPYGLYCPSV